MMTAFFIKMGWSSENTGTMVTNIKILAAFLHVFQIDRFLMKNVTIMTKLD